MTIIKLGDEPGTTAMDLSPSSLETAFSLFRQKFSRRPDLLLVSNAEDRQWLNDEEVQPLWGFRVIALPGEMMGADVWALADSMSGSVLWSPGPS